MAPSIRTQRKQWHQSITWLNRAVLVLTGLQLVLWTLWVHVLQTQRAQLLRENEEHEDPPAMVQWLLMVWKYGLLVAAIFVFLGAMTAARAFVALAGLMQLVAIVAHIWFNFAEPGYLLEQYETTYWFLYDLLVNLVILSCLVRLRSFQVDWWYTNDRSSQSLIRSLFAIVALVYLAGVGGGVRLSVPLAHELSWLWIVLLVLAGILLLGAALLAILAVFWPLQLDLILRSSLLGVIATVLLLIGAMASFQHLNPLWLWIPVATIWLSVFVSFTLDWTIDLLETIAVAQGNEASELVP